MDQYVFIHGAIWIPVLLGLFFLFSNGFRDSATIVATVVSTRAISANKAFVVCSVFEFCGAMFLGQAVASTIGKGVFGPGVSAQSSDAILVLSVAFSSAILWGFFSWWRALPISNNQALLGGLLGASAAVWGGDRIQEKSFLIIFGVLVASPILGFGLSVGVSYFLRWIGAWLSTRTKSAADKLHVLSCFMVSLFHGSNDGQLVLGLFLPLFGLTQVSSSVRFPIALAMAVGVLFGGRRILKKMAMKFYRIRTMQGLGSQLASAGTILACAATGFPASTTQVIGGSILGAGFAKNPRAVRWAVAQEMVVSWVLTFPVVLVLSYGVGIVAVRIIR